MNRNFSKARTGVFWDIEDSPIPDGLDPFDVYQKIKSAITCKGFRTTRAVDIRAYGEKNKVRDEFLLAGITVVPAGDEVERDKRMIVDILFWALDNRAEDPNPQNVVVISKNMSQDKELLSVLQILEWRDYNILLVESGDVASAMQIKFVSSVWSWQCLLDDDKSQSTHGFANNREGGSQDIAIMPKLKKSRFQP